MMASLYQSGSIALASFFTLSLSAIDVLFALTFRRNQSPNRLSAELSRDEHRTKTNLKEILEIALHLQAPVNFQNVSGHLGRIQLHIISRPMPEEARAGQQVLRLVGAVDRNLQLIQRQGYVSRLRVMRIEVHHRQNQIRPVVGLLAVRDQLIVIDRVEL